MNIAETIDKTSIPYVLWIIAIVIALPVLLFLTTGRINFLIMYLGVLFLSSLVTFPRVSFYLFLLSISIYYPTFIGRFALHPYDICFAIFIIAIVSDYLLKGKTNFVMTKLDIPFIILIIATIISAVFAFNKSYAIVPTFRIITIYIAYRAMVIYIPKFNLRKVLLFYIYQVFALSLLNCILFLIAGGKVRIFGPSWLAFEPYAMTAIPMTFAFFIWSESSKERFKYAVITIIIFIALLATQSRAPMLAVVISTPLLLIFAYKKMYGTKKTIYKKQLFKLLTAVSIVIVIGFLFKDTLFKDAFGRFELFFEALSNPKGTVYLRIVLWTAAIKAFIHNPFVGIGIGNFRIIDQIYPELRFIPVWSCIGGMSTHNVILNYLAETGILGSMSLMAITIINLKIAFNSFKIKMSSEDTQITGAILIAIIVFSLTILYMRAWTWGQDGYIMALLFAFNIAWNQRLRNKTNSQNISFKH